MQPDDQISSARSTAEPHLSWHYWFWISPSSYPWARWKAPRKARPDNDRHSEMRRGLFCDVDTSYSRACGETRHIPPGHIELIGRWPCLTLATLCSIPSDCWDRVTCWLALRDDVAGGTAGVTQCRPLPLQAPVGGFLSVAGGASTRSVTPVATQSRWATGCQDRTVFQSLPLWQAARSCAQCLSTCLCDVAGKPVLEKEGRTARPGLPPNQRFVS